MGTTRAENPWKIDLGRLRIYLERLYQVESAYYYLGYVQDGEVYQLLYEEIQKAGFILVFRPFFQYRTGKIDVKSTLHISCDRLWTKYLSKQSLSYFFHTTPSFW